MLFNSFAYFWFMLAVVPLFFLIPQRFRWVFLLGASYYFYMQWNVKYTVLIVFSTLVDYLMGLWIGASKTKRGKNLAIIWSLTTNLGLLFAFKYYNFAVSIVNGISGWMGSDASLQTSSWLLPVGISFYTFQSLSYTIDVYMGKREPEKHLGIFALYVSFFPQLVAGPIERSTHLMPQLREQKAFKWDNFKAGLTMIMTGLIKKVVIADRLAVMVNTVYGDVYAHTGGELALGTLFFAFQIYCDFSGYSDIAIGSARILGFDMMQNFNRPYLSRSVGEFWRRWHISLSTWFRDYLYHPMGGNRRGELRTAFNLVLVFFVSGVWHGASFNFMIWGLLNGAYLLIERYGLNRIYRRLEKRYPNSITVGVIQTAVTFFVICLSWIFFRAKTLTEALYTVTAIFTLSPEVNPAGLGLDMPEFWVACTSVLLLMAFELFKHYGPLGKVQGREPFIARLSGFYLMVFILIFFGVYGEYDKAQFIYFAF